MLTRRNLILSAILPMLGTFGARSSYAAEPIDIVVDMERAIAGRRQAGKPVDAAWIASFYRQSLDEIGQRIAAFELVRRIPYRLTRWTGDPDSLFNTQKGDCRHKAAAARRLFEKLGFQARQVMVVFDWANLPIPSRILQILPDTKSFHDSVEVRLGGKWMIVDPTWDPGLKAAGFPIMEKWDGVSPTLEVTTAQNPVVRFDELGKNVDLYAYFKIARPQRKRTLEFNRAFNGWLEEVRAA